MRSHSVNSRKITSLWTCDWLKVTKHFTKSKHLNIYKMYLISAERYNGGVPILIINNKKKLAKFGFGVKNMSDRVLKEILRHLWNKKPYERANQKIGNDWKIHSLII